MLTDAAAAEDVALGRDGLVEGLGAGATYVDMSTVTPEVSRRLGAAAKAPTLVARDFSPQFTLDLIHKDFRQLLDASGDLGVASPLATLAYELFGQARHDGRGGLDYSVASLLAEELAHVAPRDGDSGA